MKFELLGQTFDVRKNDLKTVIYAGKPVRYFTAEVSIETFLKMLPSRSQIDDKNQAFLSPKRVKELAGVDPFTLLNSSTNPIVLMPDAKKFGRVVCGHHRQAVIRGHILGDKDLGIDRAEEFDETSTFEARIFVDILDQAQITELRQKEIPPKTKAYTLAVAEDTPYAKKVLRPLYDAMMTNAKGKAAPDKERIAELACKIGAVLNSKPEWVEQLQRGKPIPQFSGDLIYSAKSRRRPVDNTVDLTVPEVYKTLVNLFLHGMEVIKFLVKEGTWADKLKKGRNFQYPILGLALAGVLGKDKANAPSAKLFAKNIQRSLDAKGTLIRGHSNTYMENAISKNESIVGILIDSLSLDEQEKILQPLRERDAQVVAAVPITKSAAKTRDWSIEDGAQDAG